MEYSPAIKAAFPNLRTVERKHDGAEDWQVIYVSDSLVDAMAYCDKKWAEVGFDRFRIAT